MLFWFTVWVGAITLFFHRWGKIRMLLPYQPVFKEEEPLGGLPSQASPSMATSHTLQQQQQQRILNNTNKFSSSHPMAAAVSSSPDASLRRNQFMVTPSSAGNQTKIISASFTALRPALRINEKLPVRILIHKIQI